MSPILTPYHYCNVTPTLAMSSQLSLCHPNSRHVISTHTITLSLSISLSDLQLSLSCSISRHITLLSTHPLTITNSRYVHPTLAVSPQLSLCHLNSHYHTISIYRIIWSSTLLISHSHSRHLTHPDNNKMKLYKFKTMTYGKHSIKYVAGILWNNINLDIKNTDNVFFFF